jgi:hypothetical protein
LSAAVEIRRFLKRSLIFSAAGKNRSIFSLFSKAGRLLQKPRKTIIMSFSSRCVEVVHRRLQSGILNPPDDFSQLSYLKTLLSRTEAASHILFLGKDQGTVTVTKF